MTKNNKSNDKYLLHSGAWAAFILVLTMVMIKLIAYNTSNSVSILSSFIDSGADFFTNIITLISVYSAVKPADKNHRYGHAKAESIGALFQANFIILTAVFLIFQAIKQIIKQEHINIDNGSILIMGISLILTIILVLYQNYVIKKTKSIALKANSLNYKGDILTTSSTLICILIVRYTNVLYLDAIFGLLIGLFLCKGARSILKDSLKVLMDEEIPAKDVKQIKKLIKQHKKVHGYHKFRSRDAGNKKFIEFHIELDKNLSLKTAQQICIELEEDIKKMFKNSEIIIHQEVAKEPVFDEELLKNLSEQLGNAEAENLLILFIEELEKRFENLNEAFIKNDKETMDLEFHTIKGSGPNFGALDLVQKTKKANDALKANDFKAVKKHIKEMEKSYIKFKKKVHEHTQS